MWTRLWDTLTLNQNISLRPEGTRLLMLSKFPELISNSNSMYLSSCLHDKSQLIMNLPSITWWQMWVS